MEKKEKKAGLEQLLNSLIEKGRKPYGHKYVSVEHLEGLVRFYYEDKKSCIETLRTMTSKESGLWQFVCENRMIKGNGQYESSAWIRAYEDERDSEEYTSEYGASTAEYYLLESSLTDENKLEDFLLSNIVIKDE